MTFWGGEVGLKLNVKLTFVLFPIMVWTRPLMSVTMHTSYERHAPAMSATPTCERGACMATL